MMTGLLKSELLKVTTKRRWWLPGLVIVVVALVTSMWGSWQASLFMKPFDEYLAAAILRPKEDLPPEQVAVMYELWSSHSSPTNIAAMVYSSGQFFGFLIAALVGLAVVADEYRYQTLGATFLFNARRHQVVGAKVLTAVVASAALWLVATLVAVVVGATFLWTRGGSQLGDSVVVSALLLNLVAYVLWGLLGMGIGVLLKGRSAAVVILTGLYFLTSVVVALAFQAVYEFLLPHDLVLQLQVLIPGVASQILTSPSKMFPQSPPQWLAGVVLFAYAAAATVVGSWRLARSDVFD